MRNKLKKIALAATLAALLPLTSCDAANSPSALAGHWLHESGSTDKKPEDMELFKDGTGVCDGGSVSWKVEDKRFIIQSPSIGFASNYEVSGYRLTLTDNSGKSTYVNINKDYLQKGSFTDSRDKKKYGTIKIGNQTWMSENLSYDSEGSKCYGNDTSNCQKYGRLYDWKTALSACPKGWHLPSDAEWGTLVDFAGGEVAGKNLKARAGWEVYHHSGKWEVYSKSGNGTDIYGFSALPGGGGGSSGSFGSVGTSGLWWSATENTASYAYNRDMYHGNARVDRGNDVKAGLSSVRCVQD